MSGTTLSKNRLASFVSSWRALHAEGNAEERLKKVLSTIRPHLPAAIPTRFAVEVDRSSLIKALASLAPVFEQSRRRGDAIDVWSVAGLGHDEVRNARVLAWLLDPKGSHGAGDAYLLELWSQISGEKKAGFALKDVQRVVRENYPIGNGDHRIDIEITGADFIMFVEVKIYAGETKARQVEQYVDLAARKAASLHKRNWAVLYLAEAPAAGSGRWVHLRWKDVARSIKAVARRNDREAFSTRLAILFASHVSRHH